MQLLHSGGAALPHQSGAQRAATAQSQGYSRLADEGGLVLPNAFAHVPDLRHVLVETGIHTIGASA